PLLTGDRCFRLRGAGKGSVRVVACDGPRPMATLDVETKFMKKVNAAFNFVRDKKGPKTTRNLAAVTQWVREVNGLFEECNVEVMSVGARWVKVDADLPRTITYTAGEDNKDWDLITAQGDPHADVNVFHVEDVRLGGTTVDNAKAMRLSGDILIDDVNPH